MVDVVAYTLRLLHIVFGVAWVGALLYGVAVLRVVLPRVDPGARRETLRHLIPINLRYTPLVAVFTIVFGASLYVWMGRNDLGILVTTQWGLTLLIALILALLMFGYGMGFVLRAGRLLHGHLEEEKCEHQQEVGRLQRRFNGGQVTLLGLGLLIIGLMVFATDFAAF